MKDPGWRRSATSELLKADEIHFIVGLAPEPDLELPGVSGFLCPEEPDGPDIAETLMGMGKRVTIEYLWNNRRHLEYGTRNRVERFYIHTLGALRGGEQYIVAKHTLLKMKVLLLHAGNSPFVS